MADILTTSKDTDLLESRVWTLDEAFEYCARVTSSHYENFPVASLFLPAEKRQCIQAVYAFSRAADDFADEGDMPDEDRIRMLDGWEARLTACEGGEARHPVFVALGETIKRNEIPPGLLHDLVSAFRQDVVQHRYGTFDDLLGYCSRSANPVGRIVLSIFGYRDESLHLLSDRICTGLQLTNFWQDISVDRMKDRLYLPLEDIVEAGYSVEEWQQGKETEAFRQLLRNEVERTKAMFYEGASLPTDVDRDLHTELKLVWLGGMEILRAIERTGYRTMHMRPVLTFPMKILLLLRLLWVRDLAFFRKRRPWWDLTQ